MNAVLLGQDGRTTRCHARRVVAEYAQTRELDVGFYDDGLLVVYALVAYPPTRDWVAFARDAFPAITTPLFFTVPPGTRPENAGSAARLIAVAAKGIGYRVHEAAFALGGAQAVADLVLSEQAQDVPAQPVLPA